MGWREEEDRLQGFGDTDMSCPQLTGDVARCKPIAQTLDNVEAITCDYILDSLVSGAAVCGVTHVWGGNEIPLSPSCTG